MSFTSDMDPNKDQSYYHLLPKPEPPLSPAKTHLKDEGKRGKNTSLEDIEDDHKVISEGSSALRKTKLNRYALAGAILASTNSILLGYGEFKSNRSY